MKKECKSLGFVLENTKLFIRQSLEPIDLIKKEN